MTNEDCLRVLSPPFAARFQPLGSPGAARDSWRLLGEGRRANMGPVPPHPAPWVFSPPGRCKAGAGGESSLRVICTSKAALPPTLRRPACARWLALIALSKAAPVLALLRFLGPTQPPPPTPPYGQKLVRWHRGVKRRCKSAFLCLRADLHPLISSTANSASFCCGLGWGSWSNPNVEQGTPVPVG